MPELLPSKHYLVGHGMGSLEAGKKELFKWFKGPACVEFAIQDFTIDNKMIVETHPSYAKRLEEEKPGYVYSVEPVPSGLVPGLRKLADRAPG